jgi:hypothetical protein
LQTNAKGWAWGKATGRENWVRTDGTLASYDSTKHLMVLQSASFKAALDAQAAADEKNK